MFVNDKKLLKSNFFETDKEVIIEVLEGGRWEFVGHDPQSAEGWSTNSRAKVFRNETDARKSALYKRIEQKGYSEKNGTLRIVSQ